MALLGNDWDDRLRLYMTAIVQNHGHKMLAINNVADHMHMFVGLSPDQAISDMMRNCKCESSEWINENGFLRAKFAWQDGYGAFSNSRTQIDQVVRYIANQQEHHRKVTFGEEYRKMLIDFDVAFDERYLFKEPV